MSAPDETQQMTSCPQCGAAVGIDGLCHECESAAREEGCLRDNEQAKRSGLAYTHRQIGEHP